MDNNKITTIKIGTKEYPATEEDIAALRKILGGLPDECPQCGESTQNYCVECGNSLKKKVIAMVPCRVCNTFPKIVSSKNEALYATPRTKYTLGCPCGGYFQYDSENMHGFEKVVKKWNKLHEKI